MQEGLWFDGQTAVEHPVRVRADAAGLVLDDAGGESHQVNAEELVRLSTPKGQVRLARRASEGWRLVMLEPIDPDIERLLPSKEGVIGPEIRGAKLAVLSVITAVTTLFAGVLIFAPQVIATRLPMNWERRLGAAYSLPIEWTRCSTPEAQEALGVIMDRLDPDARADGFTLELVNVGMANAVALPGGRMLLFRGLLEQIDNPAALAGIVAHEVAHVRRRHVAGGAVRQIGLSAIVTMVGGGAIVSNASGLASLKFSRSAEAEADQDAVAMLAAARVDPRWTGALFRSFARQSGEGGGMTSEFLESHPLSTARAKLFESSFVAGKNYDPLVTDAQWSALRDGCSEGS